MSTAAAIPVATSAGGPALDHAPRGCARHPTFLGVAACPCGAPLCSACARSRAHGRCGSCRAAAGEAADVVDVDWRAQLLIDALQSALASVPRRAPLLVAMGLVSFAVAAVGLFEAPDDDRLREPAPLHLPTSAARDDGDEGDVPAAVPTDEDDDGIDDAVEARWLAAVMPACGGPSDDDDGWSCPWPAAPDQALSEDVDADRDGRPDRAEGLRDDDDDGVPNFVDPIRSTRGPRSDDDDDGIDSATELAIGSSPFSSDSDDDGLPDQVETRAAWGAFAVGPHAQIDTDGDGVVDARDRDSDGDGIDDRDEAVLLEIDFHDAQGEWLDTVKWEEHDSDSDGVPNFRDRDDDDDGIPTGLEIRAEFASGPSYDWDNARDTDSDDDGLPDVQEAHLDRNADGIADELQADDAFAGPPSADEEVSRFTMTFAIVMLALALLLQPLLPSSLVRRSRRRTALSRLAFAAVVGAAILAAGALLRNDTDFGDAALVAVALSVLAPCALTLLGALALGLPLTVRGVPGAWCAHAISVLLATAAQLGCACLIMLSAAVGGRVGEVITAAYVVVVTVILLVGLGGFAAGSARFSADRLR